jgi:putative ABC transport system permease protein
MAFLNDLFSELRLAARALARKPSFSLIVVATLTISVGAGTAMFAVVNAVVLRPLPFPEESRLLRVHNRDASPGGAGATFNVPGAEAERIGADAGAFESIVALEGNDRLVTGPAGSERVSVVSVTHGWMPTLGVAPVRGRGFTEDEYAAGEDSGVAIVSHAYWRARLGGAPIAGRLLTVDERRYEVIGVFPPGFNFPYVGQIWVPARPDALRDAAVFARLRPGIDLAQARRRTAALLPALRAEQPMLGPGLELQLTPARESLIENEDRTALALLGIVLAFVIVAGLNLANLLVARSVERRREIALRAALGAGPVRQFRSLALETLLLGAIGAGGAALVAGGLLPSLTTLVPSNFIEELALDPLALDSRVLAFALAAAIGTQLLACALMVWRSGSVSLPAALAAGGRVSAGGRGQSLVVAAQLALSFAALAPTAALVGHARVLERQPIGLDRERLAVARVQLPPWRYAQDPARRVRFVEAARAELARLPGVDGAGVITANPIAGGTWTLSVDAEEPSGATLTLRVNHRLVTPGLLGTVGTPVLAGRDISPADTASAPRVALVSRRLAERAWPGQDAVGRRIRAARPGAPWITVAGVAADVRDAGDTALTWYLPYAQNGATTAADNIFVMTRAQPGRDLAAIVRMMPAAVHRADPDAAVFDAAPMPAVYSGTIARDRLTADVSTMLGFVGLALAALGTFGITSLFVNQRRLEFGIRLALGADGRSLRRLVGRRALALLVLGLPVGSALGLALVHVVRSMIPGVAPLTPPVFALLALALTAVTWGAGAWPARRAAATDPVTALRSE